MIWAYLCVPELAGLSKTEIDLLFEQKVPAWRSVAWKKQLCVIPGTEVDQQVSQEQVDVILPEKM
jgi:SP family sugar:H+ symporter-like MFS transporter